MKLSSVTINVYKLVINDNGTPFGKTIVINDVEMGRGVTDVAINAGAVARTTATITFYSPHIDDVFKKMVAKSL